MVVTTPHQPISRHRLASPARCRSPLSRCRSTKNLKRSLHRNQQYSITAITDASGSIAERYAYSAYGAPTITDASGATRTTTAIGNRYTYTGREWDEVLALYHYRARMYDPAGGRFVSRDPIGYGGGINSYGNYFKMTAVDPHGTQATTFGEAIRENCADRVEQARVQDADPEPTFESGGVSKCAEKLRKLYVTLKNGNYADETMQGRFTKVWSNFGPGCRPIAPSCKCCKSGFGGLYSPSRGGRISICANPDGSFDEAGVVEVLIHEGTHRLQDCYWKDSGDECDRSIKWEMEAYSCSGSCNNFESCMNRAIWSSCWRSCGPGYFSDQKIEELRDWYSDNEANFCNFPRPGVNYPPSGN